MVIAGLVAAAGFYGGQFSRRQPAFPKNTAQQGHTFSYTTATMPSYSPQSRKGQLRRYGCKECFKYKYPNLISPKGVCRTNNSDIILVILITSVPKSIEARMSIRQSWARFTNNNTGSVRYVFLFGGFWGKDQDIIDKESQKYDDILQDHFIDIYRHLSLKVLMGFRWVLAACPMAKFVMRAADDTYVNVPGVIHLLQEHGGVFSNKMAGHCVLGTMPVRTIGHKWYVPFESFPGKSYPPYCIGTTYMQTLDVTKRLVDKSKDVPFFEMEDVYFGLVIQQTGISLWNIAGFDVHWAVLRERPFAHWYTLHGITPLRMLALWYMELKRHEVYRQFFTNNEGKANEGKPSS